MGRIHSIETMGALDGPGLRMVVFLQGCPLRCKFCHNPDTWNPGGGQEVASEAIVARAVKLKRFFGARGGVTFSGGEPLGQAKFVRACVGLLHEQGIHCALDTSGGLWNEEVQALLDACDLVLLDVKHSDPARFHDLTGGDPAALDAVLAHLALTRKPVWVRQVIVPGWTQDEAQVRQMLRKTAGINRIKTELLPYHTLGVHKWRALGIPYALEGAQPPSEDTLRALRALTE